MPGLVAIGLKKGIITHFIMDAQHRGTAALELGLPIIYIVHEELKREVSSDDLTRWLDEIIKINNEPKRWTTRDYLESYCERGDKSYIAFKEWIDSENLGSVDTAIYMIGHDNSSRSLERFRNGLFKTTTDELISGSIKVNQWRQIASYTKDNWTLTNKFIRAFLYVRELKNYDHDRMLKQMQKALIHKKFVECGNREQYIEMFDAIFNYDHRTPKNLRFNG